jgi:hypothetical protein
MVAESTLSGRDSRLPPQRDEGARARTEASVSKERRRRRLDEDASVRIEALSVSRLLAVAVVYVVRCGFAPETWAGMADAGDEVGNGWLNWRACELEWEWWGVVVWWLPPVLGATVCIVVRVVVSDRTEGAGEEKVLSPPLLPFAVRLVPASEDPPIVERHVSCSVDPERPAVVGGWRSSLESRTKSPRSRDTTLVSRRLGPVETE